jgi:membrane-associated phospholipid phosphatase
MLEKLRPLSSDENRIAFGFLLFAGVALAYFVPNQCALYAARPVPIWGPDRLVPFDPRWIWVYVSYYPFIAGAYLLAPSRELRLRYAQALAAAALAGLVFFLLCPTCVGRAVYPVPGAGLSARLLGLIRAADADANCLPSMHVAMSCLAAGAYAAASRRRLLPAAGWALLIAYSTMATKQHHFLDVAAGAALAAASAGLVYSANSAKRSWVPRKLRKK